MTPDDLPTTDGYVWRPWANEWWCVSRNAPSIHRAVAAIVSRRMVIPKVCELLTPAEVHTYYHARPHVPCPFRWPT